VSSYAISIPLVDRTGKAILSDQAKYDENSYLGQQSDAGDGGREKQVTR
jgi:hypothetical protein